MRPSTSRRRSRNSRSSSASTELAGKADRLARVARIRGLQKQRALAEEGKAAADLDQLRQMRNRIETLRHSYTPVADDAAAFALKSMAHQYDRLGKALANTLDRAARAEVRLEDARQVTLSAHRRKRAAEELADRAEAAEAREAEARLERAAPPRRITRA
jgi:flagellar FliJ protein